MAEKPTENEEQLHREEEERAGRKREKELRRTSFKVFIAVAVVLVLSVVLLVYWAFAPGSSNAPIVTPGDNKSITTFELKLKGSGISPVTVNLVAEIIKNRTEILGAKNATIHKYYENSSIAVDVPGAFTSEANDIFGEGKFEIKIQVQGNQTEHVLYGDQITSVDAPENERGEWGVPFELSDKGAQSIRDAVIKYGAVTDPNAHYLSMYLDNDLVFSAPLSPELAKNMQYEPLKNLVANTGSGDSGQKMAKKLMIYLRTGALPVPVDVKLISSIGS